MGRTVASEHWKITGVKHCKKCSTTKPATLEFFCRSSRDGFSSQCKKCDSIKAKKARTTREKIETETHKQCIKCWEVFCKGDGFYKNSRAKDGLQIYCKKCQRAALSESRAKHGKKWRKSRSEVVYSNPRARLHYRALGLVRKSLDRIGLRKRNFSVTKGFWSSVDYCRNQLADHLEKQFLAGMGWHNMREWHIDHIVPVSSFSFKSIEDDEFKACWALSNLRPLWAKDNLLKSNNLEFLI